MAKGLGGGAKKLGTGKVDPGRESQWLNELTKHNDTPLSINVKYVGMNMVSFDEGNPRTVEVTPEDIEKYQAELKLPPAAFDENDETDWEDDYKKVVKETLKNETKIRDFMSIALFAASLRDKERLINPITVWQNDGVFFKITGERRYLAHKLLGEEQIMARIYSRRPSDLEIAQIQHDENEQREELCLADRLRNIEMIINAWKSEHPNKTVSLSTLQQLCGKSKPICSRYMSIMNHGTEKLRNAIGDGRLENLKIAAQYASYAKMDQAMADEELDKYLRGARGETSEDVRKRAISGQKVNRDRRLSKTKSYRGSFIRPQVFKTDKDNRLKAASMIAQFAARGLGDAHIEAQLRDAHNMTEREIVSVFETLLERAVDRVKG